MAKTEKKYITNLEATDQWYLLYAVISYSYWRKYKATNLKKGFSHKISTLVIHEIVKKKFLSQVEIIRLDFSEGLFSCLRYISATG